MGMIAQPTRLAYTARPGEAIQVFRLPDGSFAIGGGRISIVRSKPPFAANVVADLDLLVRTREGQAVFTEGDELGHRVTITKPDLPTEPPNAWTVPDDLAAACAAGVLLGRSERSPQHGTGAGCGSTIVYDPVDWPQTGNPDSPSRVAVLLLMLRQANLNARGASDPAKPDWGVEEPER
jgi:hypothetical protein